jgi:hypothetical protein
MGAAAVGVYGPFEWHALHAVQRALALDLDALNSTHGFIVVRLF